MKFEQLVELIQTVSSSNLGEFKYEEGDFKISLKKEKGEVRQVGEQVQKGKILAIVEAMKLMNEIESEFDGTIEEILVENGAPVEYGQPLFIVR